MRGRDLHYGRQLQCVCIGPQRTATSWLHRQICTHPDLAFPENVKETMFFDKYYEYGIDWYWRHFPNDLSGKKCGEVAPTYFDSEEARLRLADYPELKVIINVRNPVNRTYSLFRLHRTKGRVPGSYFEAVRECPSIESSGKYAVHCPEWERLFGDDRVHYILQEDIEKAPEKVLEDLFAFIGVRMLHLGEDAMVPFGQNTEPKWRWLSKTAARVSTRMRSRGIHAPLEFAKRLGLRPLVFGRPAQPEEMPDDVRRHLLALHEDDITFLERRLNRRFPEWRRS